MNANSPDRNLEAILFAAIASCWLIGCVRGRTVNLHYLANQAEPRTAHVFFPARIAVSPTAAPSGMKLGAVFNANGYREAVLISGDLSRQIAEIALKSLAAAGLKPQIMNASASDLPVGIDFVLTSRLESLHCIKRYVGGGAPAGAFVMYADARIHFTLAGRGGRLYSATKSSELAEPRQGVNIAKYKPPFVHPVQTVSAVVSRSIAQVIADPEFQQMLPRQAMPSVTPVPSTTPKPGAPRRAR